MNTENSPKIKLAELVSSKNIAEHLSKDYLEELGKVVVEGYRIDLGSRSDWEQQNEKAMKLALQVQEAKSFPWPNCSNVKFPLLTIAALQFLARVSIMTKGRGIAKVEAVGQDPQGRKAEQAKRISNHLSLQLVEEDKNWVNSDEQAKLAAAILGSAFKKTYVEALTGTVISEHVPVMNLVLDYFCKDIDKAERITHILSMSGNALKERARQGLFLELDDDDEDAQSMETNLLKIAADAAEGLHRPQDSDSITPSEVLEQLCWIDLDGDGYKEPYIVSVHHASEKVLRVVARYLDAGDVYRVNDGQIRQLESEYTAAKEANDLKEESRIQKEITRLETDPKNLIVRIVPMQYYTRYLFVPSPDGGVYGLGLGSLLGPMNESVNTLVNQLIDGGTMANTAGGFLGRGVKIKAGTNSFAPFEWKPVDSPGNDLRQNIFPLPVREPSAVLFQLLGMLVTYSEKISGSTDIMTGGNPGQNTPAETSRNTVEQGMMLFSGIYARMYRSFREELGKVFEINRLFFKYSPRFQELTDSDSAVLEKDDYTKGTFLIFPSCSPEAVSTSQRRVKAEMLYKLSTTEPGFDRYKVTVAMLEAWDFDGIDNFYPDPKGPNAIAPPANPKIELEKQKLQLSDQAHKDHMQLAIAEFKEQIKLTDAKVQELQAKSVYELAQAQGVDSGHQIALIEAQIGAARQHKEGLLKALDSITKAAAVHGKLTQQQSQQQQGANSHGDNTTGQAGVGAPSSDPGMVGATSGE